jgi:hypothetical protein
MQSGNLNLPDITEDSSNIMVYQVTGRGQGNLFHFNIEVFLMYVWSLLIERVTNSILFPFVFRKTINDAQLVLVSWGVHLLGLGWSEGFSFAHNPWQE